jgi:hypothetical protein
MFMKTQVLTISCHDVDENKREISRASKTNPWLTDGRKRLGGFRVAAKRARSEGGVDVDAKSATTSTKTQKRSRMF